MSEELLRQHRIIWEQKPILRELYTRWYREMAAQLAPGPTLELGGGSGNFKQFAPGVVSTDVIPLPWIDVVADAQNLPFEDSSFDNFVLFDVLHHIENPCLFFAEALRVLRPKGRIIMMEPYISPVSWWVYNFLHPEPVDFAQDPLALTPPDPNRQPFDANQAFATILFERQATRFRRKYPNFSIRYCRRLSFFVYPLSGGFDKPSLIPLFCLKPILALENSVRFLSSWFAFRILVVLEKAA
ncbi:class I SAM-dependent methyltransferase [bacterium]|nr:class I SAM-dependent methyltransferase [bacterium]